MTTLDEKFKALEADNAPGQEARQDTGDLNAIMRGVKFNGVPVDFSHGNVDAFPPTPGTSKAWKDGFEKGGQQDYALVDNAHVFLHRNKRGTPKNFGKVVTRHDTYSDINVERILKLIGDVAQFF